MELMTFLKIKRQNVSIRFLHKMQQKMRKINLFISILLLSGALSAQKAIIINGGQFGNPQENVNITIYDPQNQTTTFIDTIGTSSVQDVLIDGSEVYVAAQDSIVKYDLINQTRIAAAKFQGVSTKTMAIVNNELVVGNWYAKTSDNLYIYDKSNLNLLDSVTDVSKGVTSMVVDSNFVFVNQNASTSNFEDTLGYILKVNITTRSVTDTLIPVNYTQDIGEFILKPDGSGFYSFNNGSNSVATVDFATLAIAQNSMSQDFKVGNKSQYSIYKDTLFLRMNEGIGAINLSNLTVIDSLIIDTTITAFTYDTSAHNFYVTQTDFFSYRQGGVYSRGGIKLDTLTVGYSPEVIRMYYNQTVGLAEGFQAEKSTFTVYPNPASNYIKLQFDQALAKNAILQVYNQKGQLINSVSQLKAGNAINISSLDVGAYVLRLISGETVSNQKIIVQ